MKVAVMIEISAMILMNL